MTNYLLSCTRRRSKRTTRSEIETISETKENSHGNAI